jgi:hypothetical protein
MNNIIVTGMGVLSIAGFTLDEFCYYFMTAERK